MTTETFGACYARWDAGTLTVGNDHVERAWRVAEGGRLRPFSLLDKAAGVEWLRPLEADSPAAPDAAFTAEGGAHRVVGEPSLVATLAGQGWGYRFEVFEGSASVTVQDIGEAATPAGPAEAAADAPTGVESDEAPAAAASGERRDLDVLALAPLHLRLTAVELRDRTDGHNELVFEREWLLHPSEGRLDLSGCLFYAEDVLTKAGLVFLKLAPLPHARPEPSGAPDLTVLPRERTLRLPESDDYPLAVICYQGGTHGRIAALQRYQRCLRRYEPGRDGLLLSNTWGDRGRDGRVNEPFLRGEIEAGARLGVDVVQIDDGWQRGTTANSVHAKTAGGVWEGFWKADPEFWAPHPERFPNGLAPLVTAAREKGMRFGLWFAPDSTDDFAQWSRDADTLLRLHREEGIDYFKIDGVKMRTKAGERNLRAFFDRVLRESAGRVVFDCDVTAEVRPGYFGLPDAGPLFVENRYTDWRRYWPHATLRNLWKLAHHVDPVRLRMEWLNNARNAEQYAGDPLAPGEYSPAYLFASVLASSPLGWFEVQNLPEGYFEQAAPLIAVWKEHREAFFSGTVLPIGDAPDGTSVMGFASIAEDGESFYLLAFRERSEGSYLRPELKNLARRQEPTGDEWSAEVLAGDGKVLTSAGGVVLPPSAIYATVARPLGFLFAQVSRR